MNTRREHHVVLGLSGGVDSAVAALSLINQGYRVTALFMKNWEEDDTAEHCAAEADLKEARQVCQTLGIELRTVNFSSEYWDRVFSYFLDEYRTGRTPNPDVLCNKEIKFKAFLEHALRMGADYIATGHYAGVHQRHKHFELVTAKDIEKDQTYFLYTLGQNALSKTLFPLENLTKSEVRELAKEAGLANHDRKDSTGICFIGERNFKSFLGHYLPVQPGEIRTLSGRHKGRHDGLMYYTIGQRQGLGIGGPGGPWYVVGKDMEKNILYVAEGENNPALFSMALEAEQLHWITAMAPDFPFKCKARTRHRQPAQECIVDKLPNNRIHIDFMGPQRAITPGQSVVLYRNNICIGGGIIREALKNKALDNPELPAIYNRP